MFEEMSDSDLLRLKVSTGKEISRLTNLQMALKIALNSAYGALGNAYFRYYDLRMAESITLSGQLSIKWIANTLNQYMNAAMKTVEKDYVIAMDTDSVVGDTIVNVNGRDITIAEFYENTPDRFIKNDLFNEDFVKYVDDKTSLSLSKDGVLENKPIKYVMKHKVNKRMYTITNSLGKSVTITEDHSVIVKCKKTGDIMSIKPKNLNPEFHFIINSIDTDTKA